MQLEWYEHFADGCFRDTPPPCSSSCPLGLDVRRFAERAADGKWNSAYRIYREQVLFPGIVSTVCHAPCRESCVRAAGHADEIAAARGDDGPGGCAGDRAVDLKMIEQACAGKAGGRPRKFKLPEKPQHIAVVGAGMDGLSCALRLASHGYPVTVFDMDSEPGGGVLGMMDPEACRRDIELSFSVYDKAEFRLGTKISSLGELGEYDAVYLALTGKWLDAIDPGDGTGRANETERADGTGRMDETGSRGRSPGREGVFVSKAENGELPVTERMAIGLNAADHIEFWFQLGDKAEYTRLYGSEEPDSRYYGLHFGVGSEDEQAEDGGLPNNEGDSADAAETEAARCYRCNCAECYKVCPVMQREKQFPQRMTAYVIGTIWPNATRRPGVKMLTGCTMCGKCGEACPENIDMGECFREARKDLYNSGALAPAYHDYWMQELKFIQSDEAYLLYRRSDAGRAAAGTADKTADRPADSCPVLYFPGCQLGASDPELVIRSFEFLRNTCDDPALLLSCCGVTAEWAGDDKTRTEITDRIRAEWKALGEPVFVTGCSACRSNLARYLPEIETVSLYRWMADHKEALTDSVNKYGCAASVIYDPCGVTAGQGRDDDTMAAVRELARAAGLEIAEAETGSMPACCGFGGHIYPANPDLFDSMKPELPEGTGLTVYCANCRDAFVSRGYEAAHILEKVFGIEKKGSTAATPTERRANRRRLRAYYTGDKIVDTERRYRLDMAEGIKEKLERLLILNEQVYETLEHAEDTNEKFADRETGLFYASRRFRNMTVWICYREMPGGGFVLEDIYRHRVEIKEQ